MDPQLTFYWHDYETWGVNPQLDRPSQFAGLRTDLELEPCARPLRLYCQPSQEFLPQPMAVLVTGITPQYALQNGTIEAEFANRIAAEFSQANTVTVGYNNIQFDDEVTRYLFYRNFHDPYAHTWQNGNSRWDLINLVRACYALRPEGIQWPQHDDGRVSLKLEDLTRANGIDHGQAHDAMADVYATIAIAKLIKTKQPRLFDFAFQHRGKAALKKLIAEAEQSAQPLLHVHGFYGADNGYTSFIMPLDEHPDQPNQLIYWDLRCDPRAFLEATAETMRERRFMPKQERLEQQLEAFGGKVLALNKCPFLAPIKVLTEKRASELDISVPELIERYQWLRQQPEFRQRVIDVISEQRDYQPHPSLQDPDFELYSGAFFSDHDRQAMTMIRATPPEQLAGLSLQFEDERIPEMLFRYRARNYPATLSANELARWRGFLQQRLLEPPKGALSTQEFIEQLEQLMLEHQDHPHQQRLLYDLYRYVESL